MVADKRTKTGKGNNRRLRTAGKIPAVLYGAKAEPVSLAVDPKLLLTGIAGPLKMNTLFELDIHEDGKSVEKRTAVLKDYQFHPLRRSWLHADFSAIDLSKPLTVRVPIVVTGKAKGVVDGGLIQIIRRDIGISCLPDKIPSSIELDVSDLDIGDNIHVSDVPLPEGASPVDAERFTILTCAAPASEKEPTAAEAEGAEAPAAEGGAEAKKGEESKG